MFERGLKATLLTSHYAAPLLIETQKRLKSEQQQQQDKEGEGGKAGAIPSGLIVHTTATFVDKPDMYLGNLYYDLAKKAVNRSAFIMANDLRDHNVAVVAVAPGFMRTERVLACFNVPDEEEAALRAGIHLRDIEGLKHSESTQYIGSAIAALLADRNKNLMEKSGQVLASGNLAKEYGFTDIDGTQVPAFTTEFI